MNRESQIERNVQEIIRVESRDRLRLGWSDHLADLMTAFSGSMLFVLIHALWFGIWIVLNLGWFGTATFDEFPYGLLTMIVSLEAIFLSTFVLISENRQAMQADRRAKVDLQLNIIAEQEVTKLVAMVAEIQEHLGIHGARDPVVREMEQPTYVEDVANAVEAAESRADAAIGESSGG
jgi:uncharacterized membrane protein